jgi:hypothetical protein
MIKAPLLAATSLASLLLALTPAHALLNRAWVSGHGTDAAGCGAPASPCRTLQYVVSNVIAAGGEIDVLDPAGYGAVTITKALSIVNDGVGTAGVQATSGNAITINAGASDNVTLRGLNIDGLGTGANGIEFDAGGSLTVVDCVIRHFFNNSALGSSGNGLMIRTTSGPMTFNISNVIASDNGFAGVSFQPQSAAANATGAIDHLKAFNNGYGVLLQAIGAGSASIALSNSIMSNNASGVAIGASSAAYIVSIDNSSMTGNTGIGLEVGDGDPTVLLGRSVIVSNAQYGVLNNTSPSSLYTYGDNRINGNGTDVSSPLNTVDKPQ